VILKNVQWLCQTKLNFTEIIFKQNVFPYLNVIFICQTLACTGIEPQQNNSQKYTKKSHKVVKGK